MAKRIDVVCRTENMSMLSWLTAQPIISNLLTSLAAEEKSDFIPFPLGGGSLETPGIESLMQTVIVYANPHESRSRAVL